MNLREIKALLDLCRQYGLSELEVEREGGRVRIRRDGGGGAALPAGAPAAATAPPRAEAEPAREAPRSDVLTIESPMVGTFYRAPSPDATPYVREGDLVKRGQVVCVIEAMKLMNEIESKVAGRLVKVLVENAQPVEFGQPLFLVEP